MQLVKGPGPDKDSLKMVLEMTREELRVARMIGGDVVGKAVDKGTRPGATIADYLFAMYVIAEALQTVSDEEEVPNLSQLN